MENTENTKIIARRVQLRFKTEFALFIILGTLLLGLTIYFAIIDKTFFVATMLGIPTICFIVVWSFRLKRIYKNNHSPEIKITFCDGIFTIYENGEILSVQQQDIKRVDYKNKRAFLISPYFISLSEMNYGKVIISVLQNGSWRQIVVDNVYEPSKVCDRFNYFLGFNTFEQA